MFWWSSSTFSNSHPPFGFLVFAGIRSPGSGNAGTFLKLGFEGVLIVPTVPVGVLSMRKMARGEVGTEGWRYLFINVVTPMFLFLVAGSLIWLRVG